jgi:hypothetical protein
MGAYAGTHRLSTAGVIAFGDEHGLEIHLECLESNEKEPTTPHGRCKVDRRKLAKAVNERINSGGLHSLACEFCVIEGEE